VSLEKRGISKYLEQAEDL